MFIYLFIFQILKAVGKSEAFHSDSYNSFYDSFLYLIYIGSIHLMYTDENVAFQKSHCWITYWGRPKLWPSFLLIDIYLTESKPSKWLDVSVMQMNLTLGHFCFLALNNDRTPHSYKYNHSRNLFNYLSFALRRNCHYLQTMTFFPRLFLGDGIKEVSGHTNHLGISHWCELMNLQQ